jgi:hypothetical protein
LRSELSDKVNLSLTNEDCFRFLRARDFNIEKAKDMAEKWKIWWDTPLSGTTQSPGELDIEIDPQEDIFRTHCPDSYIGDDKDGRPIYWAKIGYISSKFHIVKKLVKEDELFIRHIRQ